MRRGHRRWEQGGHDPSGCGDRSRRGAHVHRGAGPAGRPRRRDGGRQGRRLRPRHVAVCRRPLCEAGAPGSASQRPAKRCCCRASARPSCAGWRVPTTISNPSSPTAFDLSASAPWMVEQFARPPVAARAVRRGSTSMFDTGLNRAGAIAADWPALVDAGLPEPRRRRVERWGSGATSRSPTRPTIRRSGVSWRASRTALAMAERRGLARPQVRHLANSAATLAHARRALRPGPPGDRRSTDSPRARRSAPPAELGLRARDDAYGAGGAGQAGAGGQRRLLRPPLPHDAPRPPSRSIPLGYADGVPAARHQSSARCCIGGRRRTIAGTVCMDQFVVDVGDDPVDAPATR